MQEILYLTGIGLLVLSGASGAALFLRAILGADKGESGRETATLWGLFLVGIIGGLIVLSIAYTLGR